MSGLLGLHHVALVSRDLARTADFYGRLVGLRDLGVAPAPLADPERPGALAEADARWFGDGGGRAGSLLAVVERRDAPAGHPGVGGTHHLALAVTDRDALLQWKRRFLDAGVPVTGILDRHYFQSIYVKDPDGTIVELATLGPGWTVDEPPDAIGAEHRAPPDDMVVGNRDRARIEAERWPDAVPEITDALRIRGLHHVTAIGADIERTHAFVAGRLGMRRVKRTSNFDDPTSFHWYWGVGGGAPGTLVTYFDRDPAREPRVRMGAGQVAHYAVAAAPDTLAPLADALRAAGLPTSAPAAFGPDGARFDAVAAADPDGQPVIVATATGATSYDAQETR
ncbi:VOC family protein [Roseisolibacter sp. H3M3-2]|uniref:VOC family protein n=1 Tax=Roseisolibacter sp. H3M3-2 TaxID=3031323 RepID=UPI0023DB8774|nr:VOC family protein [Roseisolibacter sp. H3M3-2]MDF1501685.1 VOC family protein [Roseisolibacter sp. H3M3-2]